VNPRTIAIVVLAASATLATNLPAAREQVAQAPPPAQPPIAPSIAPTTQSRSHRVPFIPRPLSNVGYYVSPNGVPYQGAPQPQQPASEDVDQIASSVLQIDAEATISPMTGSTAALDAPSAAGMLQSSAVLDSAVKKVLGAKARKWRDYVYVSALPSSPRLLRVDVMIVKDRPADWGGADEDVAAKLLASITQSLRKTLQESADAQRQFVEKRRAAAEKDLEASRQRLAAVRDKVRKTRIETSGITQQYGADPRSALANLRVQRQQYESQLASHRARLQAIQPSTTPLVAEWTSLLEVRQRRLDELKADPRATREEVIATERKVSEARSQLDVYLRAATAEVQQGRSRNGEVASLQANLADTEGRLKTINEQVAKLEDEKLVAMMEELPELQADENRLRNEVNDLANRFDQFRRTSAGGEISLRVLDGQPDE